MPPKKNLEILYEDNHLLALNKPPGLATMGVAADEVSLLTLAKQYIKTRYDKPGNVYLGVVSRIDQPVSGVVLFARTSKAAARLSEQFRGRLVEKIYWAVVEGAPPAAGQWTDFIAKDESRQRMTAVAATAATAREARLSYRSLKATSRGTLIEVQLETGRKHQIRLQCSLRGHPILGDRKYGAARSFPDGIALHARRISIEHPISKARHTFEAPPPQSWHGFGMPVP